MSTAPSFRVSFRFLFLFHGPRR